MPTHAAGQRLVLHLLELLQLLEAERVRNQQVERRGGSGQQEAAEGEEDAVVAIEFAQRRVPQYARAQPHPASVGDDVWLAPKKRPSQHARSRRSPLAEAKLPPGLAAHVLRYVEAETGAAAPDGKPPLAALHELLRDGELLLRLVGLAPRDAGGGLAARSPMDAPSGGRTPRAGGAQAFRHMQNFERFTKEAVRLGVPAVATFEAPALLEAADMNAVVLCINALERLRLGQFTPRS